jgi:uncharacterized protein (TIGR04255 family)
MTSDGGTLVSIGPGIATLSAGSEYEGVGWFAEQFSAMLAALAESGDVRRCDRVGVRYLDVIDAPVGEPRAWAAWFRPEVVGWAAHEVFMESATLLTSLNQMSISAEATDAFEGFPGDVQAVIRHGLVQANSLVPGIPPIQLEQEAFILDMDMFIAVPQPFSGPTILKQFRALHHEIDKFFRWILSSDGASQFELTEMPS